MVTGWEAEIERAFSSWSEIADLTFIKKSDDGLPFITSTNSGDIRFGGAFFDGPGSGLAHGFYPPSNALLAASDIHFDKDELWKIGFGGVGIDIFYGNGS